MRAEPASAARRRALMESRGKALTGLLDTDSLEAGLRSLFRINGGAESPPLAVLRRDAFINESSFPSEVVTLRKEGGGTLRLLIKYAIRLYGSSHEASWGYRRGVLHEATVYERILRPLGVSVPRFFGTLIPISGETLMAIEFIDESVRVNLTEDDQLAMELAAEWIGRFHVLTEARKPQMAFPFLKTFAADYYTGWVERTVEFAGYWHQTFPWLHDLTHSLGGWLPLLLTRPTVIHGEYYAKNLLYLDRKVYPVDWESSAIAAGEIDLATLVEGWPRETATRCIAAYQRARWPQGKPVDFERALLAAQLFNAFRWLGDEPELTQQPGMRSYFHNLRRAATRLGLIN